MGIDARMFARIKDPARHLKEADITPLSYELASTIGPEFFCITKGLPGSSSPVWGEPHHALSVVKPYAPDPRWPSVLDIEMLGKVVLHQDGEPIIAEEGEQLVQVHLSGRYYAEHYARGDWPKLCLVAEWLEIKLPGCEVWYGGDSSGVVAEPLSKERREALTRFYLEHGHRPYNRPRNYSRRDGNTSPDPVCPCCEVEMVNCGGGADLDFWICDGCHLQAITTKVKDGITYWADRHESLFEVAAAVAAGGRRPEGPQPGAQQARSGDMSATSLAAEPAADHFEVEGQPYGHPAREEALAEWCRTVDAWPVERRAAMYAAIISEDDAARAEFDKIAAEIMDATFRRLDEETHWAYTSGPNAAGLPSIVCTVGR